MPGYWEEHGLPEPSRNEGGLGATCGGCLMFFVIMFIAVAVIVFLIWYNDDARPDLIPPFPDVW